MAKDFKYLLFYNEIKRQIISKEYTEGSLIPNESQFMAKFNVFEMMLFGKLTKFWYFVLEHIELCQLHRIKNIIVTIRNKLIVDNGQFESVQ